MQIEMSMESMKGGYRTKKTEEGYSMKRITRAGILSLVFVLTFMFIAASAEVAAAGRFVPPTDRGHIRVQGKQMQAKHDINEDYDFIHLNKHELTLKKGESYTLKASVVPGGKSISAAWWSSNDKIVTVSDSGKVTAVAPGIAVIYAENYYDGYYGNWDQTGMSNECYVTVPGGSKDAKPLDTSDRIYNYGNKKFTAPTDGFIDALAKIKKSIGGNTFFDEYYYRTGLLFGSKDYSIAHTFIFYYGTAEYIKSSRGFGFEAYEKSPIKTNRGIGVGVKKSIVQQKYGLPTHTGEFMEARKVYEILRYESKAPGKGLYTTITFYILKSTGIVSRIELYMRTSYY